jgi:hypothetical protein
MSEPKIVVTDIELLKTGYTRAVPYKGNACELSLLLLAEELTNNPLIPPNILAKHGFEYTKGWLDGGHDEYHRWDTLTHIPTNQYFEVKWYKETNHE